MRRRRWATGRRRLPAFVQQRARVLRCCHARSGRLAAVSEFAMSRRSLACGNGTLVVAGLAGRWMSAA
jgi:hypothetical protein